MLTGVKLISCLNDIYSEDNGYAGAGVIINPRNGSRFADEKPGDFYC